MALEELAALEAKRYFGKDQSAEEFGESVGRLGFDCFDGFDRLGFDFSGNCRSCLVVAPHRRDSSTTTLSLDQQP